MSENGKTAPEEKIVGSYRNLLGSVVVQFPREDEFEKHMCSFLANNGGVVNQFLKEVLYVEAFSLVRSLTLTVPEDYRFVRRLDSFRERHGDEFVVFDADITDSNFPGTNSVLIPGLSYEVKLFRLRNNARMATMEHALAFLKSQSAVLVGAQGIALIWEQCTSGFLKGGNIPVISLDRPELLWSHPEKGICAPYMANGNLGETVFSLCPIEKRGIRENDFLMCVNKN